MISIIYYLYYIIFLNLVNSMINQTILYSISYFETSYFLSSEVSIDTYISFLAMKLLFLNPFLFPFPVLNLLCYFITVPCQIVVERTLSKKQQLMSMCTKIALQMNSKMDGELLAVDIPVSHWSTVMSVCGSK